MPEDALASALDHPWTAKDGYDNGGHTQYLSTVHLATSIPSLRGSSTIGGAPGQIGLRHHTDEIADVLGNRRTSGHATLTQAPTTESLEQERHLNQGCP
jgi:hypothetical protein